MKRLIITLSILICTLYVHSQSYVFVLVDVSKSVTQSQLTDAKQALSEVVTGSPLSKAFVTQGKQQDLANFKLIQGDKFAVTKFGSLQNTLAINPNPTQIQNVNTDVIPVLNSTSWVPTDNQTYIVLAKAKIAEYAKIHNIAKYKLYIISDNVQDDYGPGGKPNYPDDYTRNLAEGYNTSTNQVNEAGYTKIKFSASSLFTLSFSPNVDVSKYTLPGVIPPVMVDTTISIITPPEARKNREYKLKSETVNVNWTCANCPQGVKYTVMVTEYDGGKYREMKKDLLSNTVTFKVPDGKFKITVSSSNYPSATSDTTFVTVSTGGYGLLLFFLLLLVVAGVVYKIWNDKRKKNSKKNSSGKANEMFPTGNSIAPQSTNTKRY